MKRNAIAQSYLDHILIALAADDRGAPFRTFIDNWHAFRSGGDHVTGGDRAKWLNNPCAIARARTLVAMPFISCEAGTILAKAQTDAAGYRTCRKGKSSSVRLMVDHAVPLRQIVKMMFDPLQGEEVDRTREGIKRHLERWYHLGLITAGEDALLRGKGFGSSMPDDWNRQDPFWRYQAVGIAPSSADR